MFNNETIEYIDTYKFKYFITQKHKNIDTHYLYSDKYIISLSFGVFETINNFTIFDVEKKRFSRDFTNLSEGDYIDSNIRKYLPNLYQYINDNNNVLFSKINYIYYNGEDLLILHKYKLRQDKIEMLLK